MKFVICKHCRSKRIGLSIMRENKTWSGIVICRECGNSVAAAFTATKEEVDTVDALRRELSTAQRPIRRGTPRAEYDRLNREAYGAYYSCEVAGKVNSLAESLTAEWNGVNQ